MPINLPIVTVIDTDALLDIVVCFIVIMGLDIPHSYVLIDLTQYRVKLTMYTFQYE